MRYSAAVTLGHQVHVLAAAPQAEKAVGEWMQDIDHAEDWFCCQDEPQPYDWKEKLGAVSWLNLQPDAENIRKAAEQFVPGSVLVLSGDDATASEIAKAIPAPEAAKRLCAYIWPSALIRWAVSICCRFRDRMVHLCGICSLATQKSDAELRCAPWPHVWPPWPRGVFSVFFRCGLLFLSFWY